MDPQNQESQAPPILQGEFVVPPPAASWPRVLGVISIILGALGCLVNMWGAVAPLFADAFAHLVPQDPASQASLRAQKDFGPYSMVASLLNLVGSILLLVGGIGLCLRGRWGVKAIKFWIPWRALTAIISAIVGYVILQASLKAMSQNPNTAAGPGGAGAPMMTETMGLVIVAVGLVWALAYPAFMLIWFSRRRVREHVETWT